MPGTTWYKICTFCGSFPCQCRRFLCPEGGQPFHAPDNPKEKAHSVTSALRPHCSITARKRRSNIEQYSSKIECPVFMSVRNLSVRPDSSLWHNRDNSVLLGSCESKQGQGGKLGHGGMWKIPWIQLSSRGNNITWSSWGMKICHPPMTNMLNGLTTSTLSSWGIKIGHLLRTICRLGK